MGAYHTHVLDHSPLQHQRIMEAIPRKQSCPATNQPLAKAGNPHYCNLFLSSHRRISTAPCISCQQALRNRDGNGGRCSARLGGGRGNGAIHRAICCDRNGCIRRDRDEMRLGIVARRTVYCDAKSGHEENESNHSYDGDAGDDRHVG